MSFIKFKDEVPTKRGFYVFKYREGHETQIFVDEPKFRYGKTYSYPATFFNYRDGPCGMDIGQYIWVNSYTAHGPTEWRIMSPQEALEFSNKLFRFGRPSQFHPNGKKVLTLSDIEEFI